MHRVGIPVCLSLLILGLALPALAGEGRIPVWQYPTTIGAPGKYIVTRNIVGGGAAPVIDIQVGDVDLDINGFTLDNGLSGSPVINITGEDIDVVIRNGNLLGGGFSIDRPMGSGVVGQRVVIEDVQSENAGQSAIHLWTVNEVVIRRVNILWPGNHGIWLERTNGFTNGMIEHCAIRMGTDSWDGIHVDNGSAFAARENRIETPSRHGIHFLGSYAGLIGENTISDADGNGIFVENTKGTKVYNNVISRGETNGIRIDHGSGHNLVLDNSVRQSGWGGNPNPGFGGGHGILVEGFANYLEGNTAYDNDACGIRFDGPDNTFGRNMARLNDPAATGACAPVPLGPCVAQPAPDYCDTLPIGPPPSGNDSRGDNMASNPTGPF